MEKFSYPSPFVMNLLRVIGWTISKSMWFIRYRGRQNIPPADSGGYLIAANHQTYIDPVWVSIPIRQKLRYMAWDAAFEWKYVGRLISRLGAFPVSPEVSDNLKAVKVALRALREGAALLVFPEGGREFADGAMLPFMAGTARIASQAMVPILPVTISGGNRIWPRMQRYPNVFRRVVVTFHPLLHVADDGDIDSINDELRKIIGTEKAVE
jgi:1-acyl-sn-glycerol-3-phosphate acyltransferase